MNELTDECYLVDRKTCCYGIVMRNGHCNILYTYADLHREEYDVYVVVCAGLGILSFLICMYKYYSILQFKGSPIQKQVYGLLILASFTFILRSVDPMSHDFIYPPIVSGLISDVCTASLYSVMILSVAFWARIVLSPTDLIQFEFPIRSFTVLALFLTWFVFVFVRPMYLLINSRETPERIFHSWHILIQYSMAPSLLFLISTLASYFGIRIHRRLVKIRKANERATSIAAIRQLALKNQVVRSESHDELPPQGSWAGDDTSMLQTSKKNSRIIKVLVLMEILSLFVVGAQIYVLIDFVQEGCMLVREYHCSSVNGVCDFPFPFPIFPLAQYLGIIVMFWSFRKTRPLTKENVTAEIFSMRSMIILNDENEVPCQESNSNSNSIQQNPSSTSHSGRLV